MNLPITGLIAKGNVSERYRGREIVVLHQEPYFGGYQEVIRYQVFTNPEKLLHWSDTPKPKLIQGGLDLIFLDVNLAFANVLNNFVKDQQSHGNIIRPLFTTAPQLLEGVLDQIEKESPPIHTQSLQAVFG